MKRRERDTRKLKLRYVWFYLILTNFFFNLNLQIEQEQWVNEFNKALDEVEEHELEIE